MHRRSTKAKQVVGSSRRSREPLPDVPPLFRSDREENFRLWMKNCSLDASLAREDVIREWLARPVEARLQGVHNSDGESSESDASKIPAAATQEPRDSARSNEKSPRNPRNWLGSKSQPIDGSKKEDPVVECFALRRQRHSKLPLKFSAYSVLGLLIVTALSAIPMREVASRADAPISAAESSKAEPASAADLSVPQEHEATTTGSGFTTGPTTIEKLSIGCEDAQPCIEISTRGKTAFPKLSRLNDPDRVVMDFHDTVFPSDVRRLAVGRGCVKAVRSSEGATQSPRTRVVIDLVEPCDFELQALTSRLVLKVYPRQPLAQRQN